MSPHLHLPGLKFPALQPLEIPRRNKSRKPRNSGLGLRAYLNLSKPTFL